jgi:hypothetical protein
MEYLNLIINIILLISVGVFSLLIWKYLPSYFKQKGENLATREDIGKITHEVEKVRTLYVSETEKLKAQLTVLTGQQSRLKEKQNEALLTFFEECLTLLERLQVNLGDIAYIGDPKPLTEYQEFVTRLFTNIYTAYHRLLIYFPQEAELTGAAEKLLVALMGTKKVFTTHFGACKIALVREGSGTGRVEDTNSACNKYGGLMRSEIVKGHTAFSEYLTALNKHFKTEGSMPDLLE